MCLVDSIKSGMQLIRSGSLWKSQGFSSIVKNASFSRGWLHLAVQCLFAIITVASFVLILLLSLPKFPSTKPQPTRESRCHAKICMIRCREVPYFEKYAEDITFSISKLPDTCTGFYLALYRPMFINETLPINWLPRLRLPLHELAIIAGNLKHFPPDGFLTQHAARVRTLVLYDLAIITWTTDSLVGLSNLANIYINNCTIVNVQAHVLRPVHDTLEELTIIQSGQWNPGNITGTTNLIHLSTVDFSNNNFNDVLDKNSFNGLEYCKILYLNSCNISAIGLGAFDHLHNIEIIFLNNNLLVTIPNGLFSNILSLANAKPRINLQDNLWYCDCSSNDIRQLIANDMLLTDPICVSPESHNGKTFIEFESYYCHNKSDVIETTPPYDENTSTTLNVKESVEVDSISGIAYMNSGCADGNITINSRSLNIVSPLSEHLCSSKSIRKKDIISIITNRSTLIVSNDHWIKFVFLLKTKAYSMVQVSTFIENHYGMLWFQSTCPNEVYCLSVVPTDLRVYNIDMSADYVFCPILLRTGGVDRNKCVVYNLTSIHSEHATDVESQLQILLIISTGGICLVVGALLLYALVRKNPYLLKGSKRILFVKHKTVDALVMPPKVPVRKDLLNEVTPELNEKKIFIVPANSFEPGKLNRNKSTRSSKSNAPSYISALQPTEDQLVEWRIQNNFTNDQTTELSSYSCIYGTENLYTDIIDNDKTYESLK